MIASLGAFAAVLTSLAGAYSALTAPDRRLARLQTEVDILGKLGEGPAKEHVQLLVNSHAEDLAERLQVRWYPAGFFAALVVYILTGTSALAMLDSGSVWLVGASPLLFILAGFSLYLTIRALDRVPRDRSGARIKPATVGDNERT